MVTLRPKDQGGRFHGSEAERIELQVEGLDSEWTAVPVPEFAVDPGETLTEKLFFKPPRVSESVAGNYPFVLKVRSLVSGESKAVQGVLQVKPYHHLSMEIQPKRGHVSPARRQQTFAVTIMNLGNTEHSLQLLGGDPEEACAFEFEEEQVTISPGQQKTVEADVSATSRTFLSSAKLHVFSISARSVEAPSVAASAQAQLEQRALLSPGTLVALIFLLLIGGYWVYLIPKPPSIRLSVDRTELLRGETATISWNASNATWVRIKSGRTAIYEGPNTSGSVPFTPKQSGTVAIEATSSRENKESQPPSRLDLTIGEPPPTPDPEILSLKAPTSAKAGQPFMIQYSLQGVTKAYLAPTNEDVDLNVGEKQLVRNEAGDITYTLVAQGAGSKVAKRAFRVHVVEESKAIIVFFTASAPWVDPAIGRVTLHWQTTDAKSLTLDDGGDVRPVDTSITSLEVPVSKATV
ncbi:MAG: hypothetical protein HY248_05115, partial [Fimbriimonas ginsengisoli]|nr:hypothetical protein [Fimbriimonas ginsengisoli]